MSSLYDTADGYEVPSVRNGLAKGTENEYTSLDLNGQQQLQHRQERKEEKKNKLQQHKQQDKHVKNDPSSFKTPIYENQPADIKKSSFFLCYSSKRQCLVTLLLCILTAVVTAAIVSGIFATVRCNTTDTWSMMTSSSVPESDFHPAARTTITITPALDCPKSFTYSATANLCYKIVLQAANWIQSHQVCRQLHPDARLIVFDNMQQQQAVNEGIDSIPKADLTKCRPLAGVTEFFTSGQRKVAGDCTTNLVWKPNGEEAPFISLGNLTWGSKQPDCAGGLEHCIAVWYENNRTLNDCPCLWFHCPICQIR